MKTGRFTSIMRLTILILAICFFLTNIDNLWAQTREVVVVYFEADTGAIGPGNKEKVRDKINTVKEAGEYTILLEGYSDITGRASYNLNLSKERAELVKEYLLDLGVDPAKIEVVGKGGTDKYGEGETNEALARNRRVNMIVEITPNPALPVQTPQPTELPQIDESETADEIETDEVEEATAQTASIELSEISEKIGRAIRRAVSDNIVFLTPNVMKIGESYTVQVEVSYSFLESLSGDLEGYKLGDQIGLMLIGKGLKITDTSRIVKTLQKVPPSKWEWEVSPEDIGLTSLILSVAISSQTNVLDDNYPAYIRIIEVEPNLVHSITSSYWVMIVLILIIFAVVGWILLRRVKVS